MPEVNIFREALMLLDAKSSRERSQEEAETVATAIFPLMLLPKYSHMSIGKGLEDLANILEEESSK